MADEFNVNINTKINDDTTSLQKSVGTAIADKNYKTIADSIVKLLDLNSKRDSKTIELINSLTKNHLDNQLKEILSQLTTMKSTYAGISGEPINPDKLAEVLARKLSASLAPLFALLERNGVSIDPSLQKQLEKIITPQLKNSIPKETALAFKEMGNSLLKIYNTGRDIASAVKTMKDMRESGGGFDFAKEFAPMVRSIKAMSDGFSDIKAESKVLTEKLRSLPDTTKSDLTILSKKVESLQNNARGVVSRARASFADSPAVFTKGLLDSFIKEIETKAPQLMDTKTLKTLKDFQGSSEDFLRLSTALGGFADELKSLKNIKIEDVNTFDKAVNRLGTILSELPSKLPDTAVDSEQWRNYIKSYNDLIAAAKNFHTKLDIDDSDFFKVLNAVENRTLNIKAAIEPPTSKQIADDIGTVIVPVLPDPRSTKNMAKDLERTATSFHIPQKIQSAAKSVEAGKSVVQTGRSPSEVNKAVDVLGILLRSTINSIKDQKVPNLKDSMDYKQNLIVKLEQAAGDPLKLNQIAANEIDRKPKNSEAFYKSNRDMLLLMRDLRDFIQEYDPNVLQQEMSSKGISVYKPVKQKVQGPYTQKPEQVYKYTEEPVNIMPGTERTFAPKQIVGTGEAARAVVEDNVNDLANSLIDLQKYIVVKLDTALSKSRTDSNDWEIVRDSADQRLSEYFKLAEGFNKKIAGKQYGLDIADIRGLRMEVGASKSVRNPKLLIEQFKDKVFKELYAQNETNLADSVAQWVKRFSVEDISNWKGLPSDVVKNLTNIKTKFDKGKGTLPSKELVDALGGMDKDVLKEIYRATVSEITALQKLKDSNLVRTVSLPAAQLSPTGASVFETAQGSQRIIPKFATYKTGFENMYDSLIKYNAFDVDKEYSTAIQGIGIKPKGSQFEAANKIATSMIQDLSSASPEARTKVVEDYKAAAVIRAKDLTKGKQISDPSVLLDDFGKVQSELSKGFIDGTVAADKFIESMHNIGVSAYDVVKSLDSIQFNNIYDMFKKLLEDTEKTTSPLTALGANPAYSKNIREYETTLRKLVGTIPIADPSRPRRYAHQEKILNLMAMSSPIYEKGTRGMTADDQKQFIRDMNLAMKEFVENSELLTKQGFSGRALPKDIKVISSLGVPESQAASIDEYRKGFSDNDDTRYLAAFNATNLKMYTDNLAELSPFGAQFQQLGRNIASTTNALAFRPGDRLGTDFPSLRSSRENELISGGRYGSEGYGFNVIAELRNTANTFEDQIVISGKLADTLTSVVKTLVQPDKLGRLNLLSSLGNVDYSREGQVEDIKTKTLIDAFGNANRIFQDVLGVKQEYRGRADEALIKEVEKAITITRGKDLNVQIAKIAETFFNYYGRKFTTRYGSKGVSIAAEGGSELTGAEVAARFADKRVKVLSPTERETAGLGSAILPKSMGSLITELLTENQSKLGMSDADLNELRKSLISSGNKFMLSMFTDSSLGVVPKDEAELQQLLYLKAKNALAGLKIDLGKDVAGIESFKTSYKDTAKNPTLFKELPIDIRISSYGAAKRGLQTETLEAVMNNIISAGPSGTTVLNTKFKPEVYRKLLGTEKDPNFASLSELSAALGFEKQSGTRDEVEAGILKLLKSRGTKGTEEELYAKAKKLADLELGTSYYSNIVDEFGKSRKSLVGPKFVEIVEDPHANPPWSETDIKKQIKGEKLNIPAFGAYATIFGEQSKFVSQLSKDIPLDSKKHWEYLKALQVLNDDSSDMAESLLKSAQEVDVKDLRVFTKSTGKFVNKEAMSGIEHMPDEEASRILNNTILDVAQYPGSVNLKIPSTINPEQRESFYIPGALARATYPEPTIAGERGLDNIARRIQQIVNAAKNVDDVLTKVDDAGDTKEYKTIGRIKARLSNYRAEARAITDPAKKNGRQLTSEDEERLQEILGRLTPTLYKEEADPRLTYGKSFQSRGHYIESVFNKKLGATGGNKAEAYQLAIDYAVDQLIGPKEPTGPIEDQYKSRYEKSASVLGKIQSYGGDIASFSKQLGIQPPDRGDDLKSALESLERAKIEYYNAIATSVLGKTGSVQEFLFTRKVPAVMAKAVNATVDKTEELNKFKDELLRISKESGSLGVDLSGLTSAAAKIEDVNIEHADTVAKHKAKGLPVLKQHELGIPENYAKKLPAEFTKRFSVRKSGELVPLTEFEKGTNLAELLEYRSALIQGRGQFDAGSTERISLEHSLQNELQPFIESVRYPFTGISSVQPYEAKLFKSSGKRDLAQHSLVAPGIPEFDIGEFDSAKKQVSSIIDTLSLEREKEQSSTTPNVGRIEALTKTIEALDKAISDVIPKYVAQQQKLDFDGDQIEIHSAKTAEARKEIEQHYKTLTDFDLSKGTTAQAFRDEFTYGALVPSTGQYAIAEQQLAFEKKFPTKEGFGFLTKPFLTEDLEYLSDKERLSILSDVPGASGKAQGPLNAINNLLPEIYRNADTRAGISEALASVTAPADAKGEIDTEAYSQALLDELKRLGDNIYSVVNEGIKTQLFNTKYLNTINAQLFKINTGRDTEALNRLLKVFERNVGFGGGVIRGGGASFDFSPNMAKRYPKDLNSLGNLVGEELNTMMNELIRVGIQKGLDVKHAGETPIATEIAKLVSQGSGGVNQLIDKINREEGSYKDLKEFSNANKKALEKNLGALSTDELLSDAVKIATGRQQNPESLLALNRQQLKDYIIDALGFEGFLRELGIQVQEAATEGIMESIKSWTPKKRADELKGRTPDQYARDTIQKQLATGGVDVLNLAEKPLLPLYQFRTSGASGYAQRGIYQNKYGDPKVPELMHMFNDSPDTKQAYEVKLKEAKAIAKNLQDSLNASGPATKGSYGLLVSSTIENVKNDFKEIQKLLRAIELEGDTTSASVEDRLLGNAPLGSFAKNAISQRTFKDSKDYLEKFSRIVGVPTINQESMTDYEKQFTEVAGSLARRDAGPAPEKGDLTDEEFEADTKKYDKKVIALKDAYVRRAAIISQTDTILKAAKTKSSEGLLIQDLFPVSKEPLSQADYTARRAQISQATQSRFAASSGAPIGSADTFEGMTSTGATGYGPIIPNMPVGGASLPPMGGAPIPVHIASIAQNAGVFLSTTMDRAKTSEQPPKDPRERISDTLIDKIGEAQQIVKNITGGLNEQNDSDFGVKYRASGLKGGYGLKQIDEIKKVMLGTQEVSDLLESSSLLGTGIHSKLEQRYMAVPGTEIETPTRYMDSIAGEISGTMDVLRRNIDGVVTEIIDIKTTKEENFNDLVKAVEQLKSEQPDRTSFDFEEIKAKLPKGYLTNTKLDEVASQLNLYLAAENKDAKASAHFYSNTNTDFDNPVKIDFKFDPERLKKDMSAVAQARSEIMTEGGTFAKTASFEKAKEINEMLKQKKVSDEEIDKLLATATEYYNDVTKNRKRYVEMASGGKSTSSKEFSNVYRKASAEMTKSRMLEDLEAPGPFVSGTSTRGIHVGLERLYQRSRLYQQTKPVGSVSIDETGMQDFKPKIQEELKNIRTTGRTVGDFSQILKELQDVNELDHAQFVKAWKAYRLAVGEYYVNAMNAARERVDKAKPGSNEEAIAFGDYKKVVKDFRNKVEGSLGKATDIYTDDYRFISPESARAAGVFTDTQDLIKRNSGTLGEDENLKNIFKRLVDIDKEATLPIPRESIREALQDLVGLDSELINVYTDAEKVAKMGDAIHQAWNFEPLKRGLSRLTAALEQHLKFNVKDTMNPEQIAYLKRVLKEMKALESLYMNLDVERDAFKGPGKENRFPVLIDVPKQFSRDEQNALHLKNIERLRTYFGTPEDQGGARQDDVIQYSKKTYGPNNRVLDNERYTFMKQGDVFEGAAGKIGKFSENYKDLNKAIGEGNRTFAIAIERVIKWGAAASLVYGGMRYIKESISYISEVELAMARLQMVMNPLSTDFDALRNSAVGFAKQYGVEVTDVLAGMKVFAQQGLGQEEVTERTQTSTLASNVTTLNAKDATEALTAAMKVFRHEGENSMRFLDAWSEVESKAAITAGDLADAIKKAASAGKNAGFTFDQLNGMIAAIGSVTRQTGKEVGTSLRFIFRRLTSDKGPKELKGLGIDILSDKGTLRPGFDILKDLAGAWDDLTMAQKLSVAQAIGGTRQYNSVLVLMDNWDEVTRSLTNSLNSKGSAERRNLALMKTYAKQVEQVKATFSELKIEIGKVVLPTFKIGLSGIKALLEVVNAIPGSMKLAAAGVVLFLSYLTKGAALIDSVVNLIDKSKISFSEMAADITKGFKQGSFELFGAGSQKESSDLFGLKSLKGDEVKSINDLDSSFGKLGYTLLKTGRLFNEFLGITGKDTSAATKAVGNLISRVGNGLDYLGGTVVAGAEFTGAAAPATAAAGAVLSKFGDLIEAGGTGTKKIGELFGTGAQTLVTDFASQNASALKSLGPLVGAGAGLAVLGPQISKAFTVLTGSADTYKKQQYDIIANNEQEVQGIRSLVAQYDVLSKRLHGVNKLRSEESRTRGINIGEYKSPILESIKLQKEFNALQSQVGLVAPSMVAGFDELGNVITDDTDNLRAYLSELEKTRNLQVAMSKVDVASKFVMELTQTDGLQEWKYQLKELAKEFPVIGDLLASSISVGPKKALEVIQEELNNLLSARNKNPMSKAFDADIKKAVKAQSDVMKTFNASYSELGRTVDSIDLQGLDTTAITKVLTDPTILKYYEIASKKDLKYSAFGPEKRPEAIDIAASKVLGKMNPKLGGYIEAIPELTMEKLLEDEHLPRNYDNVSGKVMAKTGDYAVLNEKFAEEYGIATRQAILKVDEYNNIFLEYFDKGLKKPVISRAFTPAEIESNVEALFPTNEIIRKSEEELTKLNTFVTGASAGILGLSDKALVKRHVDLGERYFSDIPTDVLIQTEKGYNPVTNKYGVQDYKTNYGNDFVSKIYEPLQKYQALLTQLRAETASDLDSGARGNMGEELKKLQDILGNNSVVFHYRMAIEELSKSLSEGQRTIERNIALEKARQTIEKETAGLMAGFTRGLDSVDTGVRNISELSPRQSLVRNNSQYREIAGAVLVEEERFKGLVEQLKKAVATGEDLKSISAAPEGFGAVLNTKRADELRELIPKIGGDKGAAEIALRVTDLKPLLAQIAENTGITAKKFSTETPGTEIEAVRNEASKFIESNEGKAAFKKIGELTDIRNKEFDAGNKTAAATLDTEINKLYGKFISKFGVGDRLYSSLPFSIFGKSSAKETATSRGLAGLGIPVESVISKMETLRTEKVRTGNFFDRRIYADNGILKELDSFRKDMTKEPLLDAGNVGKLALMGSVLTAFKGVSLKEQIDRITTELKSLKEERSTRSKAKLDTTETDKRIGLLQKELDTRLDPKKFLVGTLQGLSTVVSGAVGAGSLFGSSNEDKMRLAGISASIYTVMKLLESRIGTENMPDYFKELGSSFGDTVRDAISSGDPKVLKDLYPKLLGFMKSFKADTKAREKVTGVTDEEAKAKVVSTKESLRNLKAVQDQEAVLKDLRSQLSTGNTDLFRTIESLLAATVAGTVYGYGTSKTEAAGRIDRNQSLASKETNLIMSYLDEYPELFNKVLMDTIAESQGPENKKTEFEKGGSPVLDVVAEFKKALAYVQTIGGTFEDAAKIVAQSLSKQKVTLGFLEDVQKIQDSLNNLHYGMIANLEKLDDQRLLKPIRAIKNSLVGFAGEVNLPISSKEMSGQQYAYATSSQAIKDTFTDISRLTTEHESYSEMLSVVRSRMLELERNLEGVDKAIPSSQTIAWEKQLSELKGIFEELKKSSNSVSDAILKAGTQLKNFVKISEGIKQLNEAISQVSVDQTVNGPTGLQNYIDSLDQLLGGSHPLAAVNISPAQMRMGSRVGQSLIPGQSTAKDVRRAELTNELRTATGSRRNEVAIELNDLNLEFEGKLFERAQTRSNRLLQEGNAPMVEFYKLLETFRRQEDLSPSDVGFVSDVQSQLRTMLQESLTPVTLDQSKAYAKQSLDAGYITKPDFDRITKELDAAASGGATTFYKGIGPDAFKLRENILTHFADQLKGFSADPLVNEAKKQNATLEQILANLVKWFNDDESNKQAAQAVSLKYDRAMQTIPNSTDAGFRASANAHRSPSSADVEAYLKEKDEATTTSVARHEYNRTPTFEPANFDIGESVARFFSSMSLTQNLDRGFTKSERMVSSMSNSATAISDADLTNSKIVRELPEALPVSLTPSDRLQNQSAPYQFKLDAESINALISAIESIGVKFQASPVVVGSPHYSVTPNNLNKKAAGGRIFGEGGPREDKVPAYLSPGEFVIRASAAQRIGYQNLDHMNKKGSVPGFADGSSLADMAKLDKTLESNSVVAKSGWLKWLTEKAQAWMSKRKDTVDTSLSGQIVKRQKELEDIAKQNSFADGTPLTSEYIKAGYNYFSSDDAELPSVFNPDSEDYDAKITSAFLSLRKSFLPKELQNADPIKAANSLKDLYNGIVDIRDKAGLTDEDVWLKSADPMIERLKKLQEENNGGVLNVFSEMVGLGKRKKMLDSIEKYADGSNPYVYPRRAVSTITSLPVPTAEEKADSVKRVLSTTGKIGLGSLDYMLIPGAIKSAIEAGAAIKDKGMTNFSDTLLEGLGAPAALLQKLPVPKYLKVAGKIMEYLDNYGDFTEHAETSGLGKGVSDFFAGKHKLEMNRLKTFGFDSSFADGMTEDSGGILEAIREFYKKHDPAASYFQKSIDKGQRPAGMGVFGSNNKQQRTEDEQQSFWERIMGTETTGSAFQKGIDRVVQHKAEGGPIRSFVGDASGIAEISEEQFDKYIRENAKRNPDPINRKWAYDTAKSAMDSVRFDSEKIADLRMLKAIYSNDLFKNSLDRTNAVRDNFSKLLSKPSLNRDDYEGYKYGFSKRTGSVTLEDPSTGVRMGRSAFSSYRKPDASYKPKYIDNSYSKFTRPGFSESKFTASEEKVLLDSFSYQLPQKSGFGEEQKLYHRFGFAIQKHVDQLKEKLKTASPEMVKTLSATLSAQQEALDKAHLIMKVSSEGGNIYNDPRLQKRVVTEFPGTGIGGFNYQDGKDLRTPAGSLKGTTQEVQYESVLSDVKLAAAMASAALRPAPGLKGTMYRVTGSPILSNPTNKLKTGSDVLKQVYGEKDFKDKLYQEWLKNNGSMKVYHNGGFVDSTGPIFAQKGEYVVPKHLADGTSGVGAVLSSEQAASSLKEGVIKLDGSEILDKLRGLSLRVEDKEIKLDTTELKKLELKVEDKEFKVADTELTLSSDTVKLDLSDAETRIGNAITEAFASVSAVKIDMGDTESRLVAAITRAMENANVSVSVEASGQGVGAEARDLLAEAISGINDKLISSTVVFDEKINVLERNMDSMVSNKVNGQLSSKLLEIDNELNRITSSVATVKDNVTSQINRIDNETREIRYLTGQALNFRNIK